MRLPRNQKTLYYGYCVLRLDGDREWGTFPGMAGHPVFPLREGRLAKLASRVENASIADPQSVIEHGRVIHRVFEHYTVLPFRFGTVFDTEQQARQILIVNRTELQDGLNRLRGKAEMHLKVLYMAPCRAGAAGSDVTRLTCERVADLFRPLEERVAVRELQSGEWLVDLAHLIDDSRVEVYQRVFTAAAERIKDCQILVTGPWPAYHFLPAAVRRPAASETCLRPGRRPPQRRAAVIPFQVPAASG